MEITTPVQLSHINIVPGSEKITVQGTSIPAFINGQDYIINYATGQLNFLSDGAAVAVGSLIEQYGLDATYTYRLNLQTPGLFQSQLEVYSEVAQIVSNFVVSVANGPVTDVSRVFNLTTQEVYTATAIDNQNITFTGNQAPRMQNITNISALQTQFNFVLAQENYVHTYTLSYPSNYAPAQNPITALSAVRSTTTYPRLVVVGGQTVLTPTIQLMVPYETTNIRLVTGGRALKTSTITLQLGTHYTFSLAPNTSPITTQTLTITFTPAGLLQIRTNSLYIFFAFNEIVTLTGPSTGQFTTTSTHSNEIITFTNPTMLLTQLFIQSDLGTASFDTVVYPSIQVMDVNGNLFQLNVDYSLNLTQQTITQIATGNIRGPILVVYLEQRTLVADFSFVQDVVLVDYVWGTNSINWETLQVTVPVTPVFMLYENQQTLVLQNPPIDEFAIQIYLASDTSQTILSTVTSYDRTSQRLQFTPIPQKGAYIFSYNTISQPIPEGTAYFASYKFGATRRVLAEQWAQLAGITNTTIQRQEVFTVAAGQTTVQLSRTPLAINTILIFDDGDPQESPVATAQSFNAITGILTFTSITTAASIVVQYDTTGYDTTSLRNVVQALFQNFSVGPTLTGFENIVNAFVSTSPTITTGASTQFILGNKTQAGTQLQYLAFESSPPLSDGTPTVTFEPATFDLGAVFQTTMGSYVRAPTASNIGLLEGTLEFLTGILFNPNDNQNHYFFDIKGSEPRRDRFSLYKSKNNYLNFDIWDSNGNLYRSSVGVGLVYNTEIIKLAAGATTATLSFAATPASVDINNDGTPDLYEGLLTKFIIMPQTPTYPASFKKATIKVTAYNATTKTVTFDAVPFSGNYVFSYISGLAKYEETQNFIAITWKLHTYDGQPPFYKLYMNGQPIVNLSLAEIAANIVSSAGNSSTAAIYDISTYDSEDTYS